MKNLLEYQRLPMYLNIKDEAIFVADSHLNKKNIQFIEFLNKIEHKKIKISQLILMGDMFDFLSVESKYFVDINKEIIKTLNELSKKIEIIYLEGNHDYNLQSLFPNIKVYKKKQQPVFAKYNNKTIALSHGDNFIDFKYELFCKVIRNSYFLKFLNFIDINFWLSKKIEEALISKDICHEIKDFKQKAQKRVENYKADFIVEGHYHQGMTYFFKNQKYINVPSLCCDKMYMRLNNNDFRSIYL